MVLFPKLSESYAKDLIPREAAFDSRPATADVPMIAKQRDLSAPPAVDRRAVRSLGYLGEDCKWWSIRLLVSPMIL